jgi:hypothetical protein
MNGRPISILVNGLVEAAGTAGFVKLFNALTGYHLTPQSAPDSAEARAFVALGVENESCSCGALHEHSSLPAPNHIGAIKYFICHDHLTRVVAVA